MSIHTSPSAHHHHVSAPQSPTLSSSPPSLSLDDAEPLHLLETTASRQHQSYYDNKTIRIRTPQSSMRRSVSSYSVDDVNYHPHAGSTTSISTIATTAVLASHHPHQHYHRHSSPLPATRDEDGQYQYQRKRTPKSSMAYPLVTGLRSQVDSAPKLSKSADVSKVTQITSVHHQSSSSSSSSSPTGRFRKFAVKVVKWLRQSVVEARAKSEVR